MQPQCRLSWPVRRRPNRFRSTGGTRWAVTLGKVVDKFAADFNKSQSAYKLNAIYKGNYTETMTQAIAAFRAKQQPHIVQVFEVGTATMIAAEGKGAIYPVWKLMKDAGISFDQSVYLPAVISYYTTTDGKLLSLPFNSSTPVLWYNKTKLKELGLDPPEDLEAALGGCRKSQSCRCQGAGVLRLAVLDTDRELCCLAQHITRHSRKTVSVVSTPSSSSTARIL